MLAAHTFSLNESIISCKTRAGMLEDTHKMVRKPACKSCITDFRSPIPVTFLGKAAIPDTSVHKHMKTISEFKFQVHYGWEKQAMTAKR
jgi:hypothetical protein